MGIKSIVRVEELVVGKVVSFEDNCKTPENACRKLNERLGTVKHQGL